jgi:D-glycero-D-manno-heptose 1,7-bisphosphate phosphatase
MTIRAVIIDRDGTLNVEKHYVHRIADFDYIPGAVDALRRLTERAIEIHVVTNQAGIAKGLYGVSDFRRLNAYMIDDLARRGVRIASVRFCPHHPDAVVPEYRRRCDCRKPAPGMLADILAERGLSAREAVMIGDRNSDIEAGRALGLSTCLVRTGYGAGEAATTSADRVAADLAEAVDLLLGPVPVRDTPDAASGASTGTTS